MAELELTKETRERLSKFLPITLGKTFKYVPRIFREEFPEDKSQWPIFILKFLSGVELAKSEDRLYGMIGGDLNDAAFGKISVSRGAFVEHICRTGIVGWSGYGVEYDGPNSIDALPKELLYELTNAITEHRELSEEELRGLG